MPQTEIPVKELIRQTARAAKVPVELALAVAEQESDFFPGALGQEITEGAAKGQRAVGIFQLLPTTAADYGVDPFDAEQNIRGGVQYLADLMERHQGNTDAVLREYGGVVRDQTYVPAVTARLQRYLREEGGAPAALAARPPAAAIAGMMPRSTAAGDPVSLRPPAAQWMSSLPTPTTLLQDIAGGARAGAAKIVYGGGDLIRQGLAQLGADQVLPEWAGGGRIIDKPDVQAAMTAPASVAGSIGELAVETVPYAKAASLVTKGLSMAPIAARLVQAGVSPARARVVAASAAAAAQGAAAAGVATVEGDDPETAATLAAASPIAGELITSMAPVIRRTAVQKVMRLLERGQRGTITEERERTLAQAASDLIDLPLERTWRQQVRQLTRRAFAVPQVSIQAGLPLSARVNLQTALRGPFGRARVPIAPIEQALTDLKDDAMHLLPAGQGQSIGVEFNEGIAAAVDPLLAQLQKYRNAYGPAMPARQLHDLKSVWWKAVYGRAEKAGRQTMTGRELLTSAEKEARMRGAAAIAEAFEHHAPTIARLDEAFSHAISLRDIVAALETKSRTSSILSKPAQAAVAGVGGFAGFGAGSAVGHPYVGMGIGGWAARQLFRGIESPRWHLLPVKLRRNLAEAIANGQTEKVRRLMTPISITLFGDQDNLLRAQPAGAEAAGTTP